MSHFCIVGLVLPDVYIFSYIYMPRSVSYFFNKNCHVYMWFVKIFVDIESSKIDVKYSYLDETKIFLS